MKRMERYAIGTLQVILKVAERCNLNCSYCYYFNKGDASAFDRPAIVSANNIEAIARYIASGCADLGISRVVVSFHGGEPMLLKPEHFNSTCEVLRKHLAPLSELVLLIQTNGSILTDEWLDLFRKHSVHVGVSIDGPEEMHDRFRLDHAGRSTFKATERNLKRLVEWAGGDQKLGPSTISVLNWKNDHRRLYWYLRGLGIMNMSFLLPDLSIDDGFGVDPGGAGTYGLALADIFDAWLEEDNPEVSVRQVGRIVQHFQAVLSLDTPEQIGLNPLGPSQRVRMPYQIIVIQSDGEVRINDSYVPALAWYLKARRSSVFSGTLREFLDSKIFLEIDKIESRPPTACRGCEWLGLCRGGDLENRYSVRNGFDNPSLYCEGYKVFFRRVCDGLLSNGYPEDLLGERLRTSLEKVGDF